MIAFLLFLVLVYVVIGIVGFVVKGLFWLFVVAAILFVLTVAFGGNHAGKRIRDRRG